MPTDPPKFRSASTLERAFAQLRQIIEDGLRHGFFECEITGEIVNGKKRKLVIKSGKSHHFTIAEEELPRG